MRLLSRSFRFLSLVTALAVPVAAQCTNPWLPTGAPPGASSLVAATTLWDPDGAGPLGQQLVLAGGFGVAGGRAVQLIARWDGSMIRPIGFGIPDFIGTVAALAVLPDGSLVAGGSFTVAEGSQADLVARWNGTAWTALGGGIPASFPQTVAALRVLSNGDLLAGGSFPDCILRWNGATWSSLGTGITGGDVRAIVQLPNGDVIVGGSFTTAGGVAASRLARWNGTTWSSFGGGANGTVRALAVMPNGDLVAGGEFTTIGGTTVARLARWNGTTWTALGTGPGSVSVFSLRVQSNGHLIVGGRSSLAVSDPPAYIGGFDGSAWYSFDTGVGNVYSTGEGSIVTALGAMPNGDLVAAGTFHRAGGGIVSNVAGWNGTQWYPLGNGATGEVRDAVSLPNGDVIVVGTALMAAGVPARQGVLRWNSGGYSMLGAGLDEQLDAVVRLPNGDLVVAGQPAVRRFDGSTWTTFGSTSYTTSSGTFFGTVRDVVVMPNGDLVVAGFFQSISGVTATNIARWNGTNWSPLGSGFTGTSSLGNGCRRLAVLTNGDLVAVGEFTVAGGVTVNGLARWNGTTWSAFGSGLLNGLGGAAPGRFVTPLRNGGFVVGGSFASAGGVSANAVARWNGSTFSSLGSTFSNPNDVVELPDGDVVLVGPFWPSSSVQRWNGTVWSALGSPILAGVPNVVSFGSETGTLVVGGGTQYHPTNLDLPASLLQFVGTTCQAIATPSGLGCPSSGGSNTLTATQLPWVDSTFRATATGLPTTAVVLTLTSVTGYAQGALPLSLAFSQAPAGCDLLVHPDILGVLVTTTGTVVSDLQLPNVPPLVGVTFYHQLMPIELDGIGTWVEVTATNRLELTAGNF